jgi:hypothetical protein
MIANASMRDTGRASKECVGNETFCPSDSHQKRAVKIARLKGADAELLRSLNDIVDEAFGPLPVDQLTYPVYRAEICLRRPGGRRVPEDFKVTQPKLLECSKERLLAVIHGAR